MAYSKKNHLLRVKSVIDVYLKFKTDGNTTTYVYREYIYPRYHISMATLYNYLATPVDKLLKQEDIMPANKKQLQLF